MHLNVIRSALTTLAKATTKLEELSIDFDVRTTLEADQILTLKNAEVTERIKDLRDSEAKAKFVLVEVRIYLKGVSQKKKVG